LTNQGANHPLGFPLVKKVQKSSHKTKKSVYSSTHALNVSAQNRKDSEMNSYYTYMQLIARDARIADRKREKALEELQARKDQFRKELQPEYTAVSDWMDAQMKVHGLSGSWLGESEKMIAALDARVAAVV
jgi:phosphoribosyl-ATP pyrophosphohydrolase